MFKISQLATQCTRNGDFSMMTNDEESGAGTGLFVGEASGRENEEVGTLYETYRLPALNCPLHTALETEKNSCPKITCLTQYISCASCL